MKSYDLFAYHRTVIICPFAIGQEWGGTILMLIKKAD